MMKASELQAVDVLLTYAIFIVSGRKCQQHRCHLWGGCGGDTRVGAPHILEHVVLYPALLSSFQT